MKINSIAEAQKYLYQFVPQTITKVYSGGAALERPRKLYELLGNPQDKYKVIHVAGTSGKGSTCHYISQLLDGLGFKVGVSISPHLFDIRERLQVNNQLISEKDFCRYLFEIIPAIEQMKDTKFGFPTYFEIVQGLAFYTFAKKRVDYAVMETGLGGRFDPTNAVHNPKVAVITKIGLDHKEILGNTISKIALEKAKIIKKNNLVISIEQKLQAKIVIDKVAQEEKSEVTYINKKENIKNILANTKGIQFDFELKKINFQNLQLSSFGLFQVENAALALGTVVKTAQRDKFSIDESKVRTVLKKVRVPGRMEEITYQNIKIVIDGAHNPQKMKAFIISLQKHFPEEKFQFLVAFKKGKNIEGMLHYIIPCAEHITLTAFKTEQFNNQVQNVARLQGHPHVAINPQKVAQILNKQKFKNYTIISSVEKALKQSISTDKPLIVTGSMYLIGEVGEILKQKNY